MLYNTPKSVIDAITKVVADDRVKYKEERDAIESKLQLEAMKKMKCEYVVPEGIEKEGVAHFMGAAAAAHKAGQKKFSFGGKTYPVQIKPQVAHQVNKEEVEQVDELSKDTLRSYAGKIVDKTRTMPQGKEKQKHLAGFGKAMDKLKKEEVELDEVSYSAKAAKAGKDIGKPGKNFAKIAAAAEKRYGSKEAGQRVAGAVLKKLRSEDVELTDEEIDVLVEVEGALVLKKDELDEARGRPRKHSVAARKNGEEEDDDYGPDTGPEPDQNIVNHLKKSIDTGGTHDVKFGDGSSHKVPAQVAHKVLGAMGKLKPSDRLEIQKHVGQSHKNLMDVHRMIK